MTINNKDYKSEIKLEFSEDDSLTMKITIPLISEKYETIEIIFEKKKKELFEQFKTLRSKYLKVKEIISDHRCDNNNNNNGESLNTKIKHIENEIKFNFFGSEKKDTTNLFINLKTTLDTDIKNNEKKI